MDSKTTTLKQETHAISKEGSHILFFAKYNDYFFYRKNKDKNSILDEFKEEQDIKAIFNNFSLFRSV